MTDEDKKTMTWESQVIMDKLAFLAWAEKTHSCLSRQPQESL